MSYCVNCGVELGKSEHRCPLCGVEVVNPAQPVTENEPVSRPYPSHVERLDARIDRHYTATFLSLLLLIPVFVTMFTNLLTSGALTWSLYVLGSMLLIFTVALLPLILKRRNPFVCVLLDILACILFLLLIELITETSWFLRLGLPLALACGFYALLVVWLFTRQCKLDLLVKLATALTGVGLLVVWIECIIRFYQNALTWPHWSVYALFPCLVLSACLLLLNRKAKLKSEIRRRFFI